jgi:hypothetical protein
MDHRGHHPPIRPGTSVLGFDGQKVGTIIAVRPHHLVVEKGYLAPITYRIPTSAIAGHENGNVLLNVTRNQALNQGWEAVGDGNPTAVADSSTIAGLAIETDASALEEREMSSAKDLVLETDRVEPGPFVASGAARPG